jgi:hypothetical protein
MVSCARREGPWDCANELHFTQAEQPPGGRLRSFIFEQKNAKATKTAPTELSTLLFYTF